MTFEEMSYAIGILLPQFASGCLVVYLLWVYLWNSCVRTQVFHSSCKLEPLIHGGREEKLELSGHT